MISFEERRKNPLSKKKGTKMRTIEKKQVHNLPHYIEVDDDFKKNRR